MIANNTDLKKYIAQEVEKYAGVIVPVRSSLWRRMLIHRLPVDRLHPNPEDEFSIPGIGPSFEIITRYQNEIAQRRYVDRKATFEKPLIVERIRPDGYLLLNGHHRWAAALRLGMTRVPVKIINLTQEMYIRKMLSSATRNRRVTLDLDEVVFHTITGEEPEKPLAFPFSLFFKERLYRGVPALFSFLNSKGYDVWVYTAQYISMEHIATLFRLYHAPLNGIITGVHRKSLKNQINQKRLEASIANQYEASLHITRESVLLIRGDTKEYEEYPLTGDGTSWSREIMDIVGKLGKK